jgi:hypothetical protein
MEEKKRLEHIFADRKLQEILSRSYMESAIPNWRGNRCQRASRNSLISPAIILARIQNMRLRLGRARPQNMSTYM